MNFKLFNVQELLHKKKEVRLLGKPSLQKAYANGQEDQVIFNHYDSFTHYERILRNYFQLQVNNNHLKHQKHILPSFRGKKRVQAMQIAAQDEMKIHTDYLAHIKEYKRGLSKSKNEDYSFKGDQERKVKTEIVFCFDASFGMYHLSMFKAVNKFIELLNSIDLTQTDVSIISYGAGLNTVSDFTSSKIKLLLSTSLILPVGGVTVVFENYKFASVSQNDLHLALKKANNLFYRSVHAVQDINRHVVVLSDGNLSGIVGSELEGYELNKENRKNFNLTLVVEERDTLLSNGIKVSSISLAGDNKNIIKELSETIFWENSVSNVNTSIKEDVETKTQKQALITPKRYAQNLDDMMKLNLKYTQQESYIKGTDV